EAIHGLGRVGDDAARADRVGGGADGRGVHYFFFGTAFFLAAFFFVFFFATFLVTGPSVADADRVDRPEAFFRAGPTRDADAFFFAGAFFLKRLRLTGAFSSCSRHCSSVSDFGSTSFGIRAFFSLSVMYGP